VNTSERNRSPQSHLAAVFPPLAAARREFSHSRATMGGPDVRAGRCEMLSGPGLGVEWNDCGVAPTGYDHTHDRKEQMRCLCMEC
jgi:hypothetical protein